MTDRQVTRLRELDAAKGLAITLVVWGHIVARDHRPLGNDWYAWFNGRLYAFHMAFFFFLAGYVYFMRPDSNAWARWKKTASRLVPAYIMFVLIIFSAKLVAASYISVDRPVGAIGSELALQFLFPTQGFASFLWFIVVILQIQILAPLTLALLGGRLVPALLLALALHLLSVFGWFTELFALQQLTRYLLFFLLGAAVVPNRERINHFVDRSMSWLLPLFLVLLLTLPGAWLPTVAGLLCLPALMAPIRWLDRHDRVRWLVFLGVNSFTIYLMNSLSLGLGRALIIQTTGWDHWRFPVAAVVLLTLGLVLPVIVQRLTFGRFQVLDRMTR